MRFCIAAVLLILAIGFIKAGSNLRTRQVQPGLILFLRPRLREIKGAPVIMLGNSMLCFGLTFILGIIPVLFWSDNALLVMPAIISMATALFYSTLFKKHLLENDSTKE